MMWVRGFLDLPQNAYTLAVVYFWGQTARGFGFWFMAFCLEVG